MKKLIALTLLASVAVGSNAAVLWDQSDYTLNGIVNQEFSDFPTFSSYSVGDVTLGSASNLNLVSILITAPTSGFLTNVTTGRLNIFAKTGAVPSAGNDPTTGATGAITTTLFNANDNVWKIEMSGLNINLAAGSYWVGLAPLTNFATDGQVFHLTTNAQVGDASTLRNPGGGFGFGTAWSGLDAIGQAPGDTTLHLEGTAVPEPASMAVLGLGIAAMVRRRRTRK